MMAIAFTHSGCFNQNGVPVSYDVIIESRDDVARYQFVNITAPEAAASFDFFGRPAAGSRIAFVLDISGSMIEGTGIPGETRDMLQRREVNRVLRHMAEDLQYEVIVFSGNSSPLGGLPGTFAVWKPTSPTNVAKSLRDLAAMEIGGGTDWGAGLSMALAMDPRPDLIYFVTDGVATGPEQAVAQITELNHAPGKLQATIQPISLLHPDAKAALEKLASENGGSLTVIGQGHKIQLGGSANNP